MGFDFKKVCNYIYNFKMDILNGDYYIDVEGNNLYLVNRFNKALSYKVSNVTNNYQFFAQLMK